MDSEDTVLVELHLMIVSTSHRQQLIEDELHENTGVFPIRFLFKCRLQLTNVECPIWGIGGTVTSEQLRELNSEMVPLSSAQCCVAAVSLFWVTVEQWLAPSVTSLQEVCVGSLGGPSVFTSPHCIKSMRHFYIM